MEWAEKDVRKKDDLRPELAQMKKQNRFGVYFILKSMEIGPSFRITAPKFPTKDPNYRILSSQRNRYTHYYFYIWDDVLGPISLCVGSFLPFSMTFWLNGHHFIERELLRQGVSFRKDDNAFLSVSDPNALQSAADRLSADIIRKQLNYWSLVLGPKFSKKEREAINLNRMFSIQQVEYCRNFIFKRHFPIHQLYERSCDIGLMRLTADKVSNVFGFRLHKRLRGKLQTVLEKIDHGHHVLRACAKSAVLRMYEKFSTFLRSGHLFVFTNRQRNRVKVLFFDGSGLWICAKRLERGTFGWPEGEGASCSLRPEQLQLLLHGMEGTSRRRWYRR
jgi:hypothetical protein